MLALVYLKLPYGLERPDGSRGLHCDAETVGDLLTAAFGADPTLRSRICRPDGNLRVSVVLNGWEIADDQVWDTRLEPGAQLSLLPHIRRGGYR